MVNPGDGTTVGKIIKGGDGTGKNNFFSCVKEPPEIIGRDRKNSKKKNPEERYHQQKSL